MVSQYFLNDLAAFTGKHIIKNRLQLEVQTENDKFVTHLKPLTHEPSKQYSSVNKKAMDCSGNHHHSNQWKWHRRL